MLPTDIAFSCQHNIRAPLSKDRQIQQLFFYHPVYNRFILIRLVIDSEKYFFK